MRQIPVDSRNRKDRIVGLENNISANIFILQFLSKLLIVTEISGRIYLKVHYSGTLNVLLYNTLNNTKKIGGGVNWSAPVVFLKMYFLERE